LSIGVEPPNIDAALTHLVALFALKKNLLSSNQSLQKIDPG